MADEEKPGAGGAGASSAGTQPTTVYVDANVESLAARHGGKDQAIKKLFRDGKKARDRAREAEKERDAAIEAAKPKPGEIRLTGDDAKAWEAYRALGKPDEIAPKLKEHGTLSEKVQKQERETLHTRAATAAGFKNAAALADLAETKKLNIVIRSEKVNDKDTDVAYVQPGEQGAAPVKLTEYVDQHLAIYKPALLAPSAASTTENGASGANGSARRTPMPEQSASPSAPAKPDSSTVPLREARVLPSQRGREA